MTLKGTFGPNVTALTPVPPVDLVPGGSPSICPAEYTILQMLIQRGPVGSVSAHMFEEKAA